MKQPGIKSGFEVGIVTLLLLTTPATADPDALFIAGLEPSHRPDGAPVITSLDKDAAWYARALKGIDKPYPQSLSFLEDQGAWYTPFLDPGMTAYYDIRVRHQE